MTPSARLQAAIEVVDAWRDGHDGLDRVLAAWGRASRYAGSGDRRAIADLVYDAARRLRSAAWVAGRDAPDGRGAILGSLILDGQSAQGLASLFSGPPYGPAPLSDDERARFSRPLGEAPRPVRLDYPDWIEPHAGDLADAILTSLRSRAPLFLRVNLLKSDVDGAIAALAADGIIAAPGPLSPTCLAVSDGARRVMQSTAFRSGLVEVQDAASQAVSDYTAAQPGETLLDYCAGAGGKTLALAAAMAGEGRLYAHDAAPARLAQLPKRAARAGADVTILDPGGAASLESGCDLVLVDAPCSGSGAWRRNPDAKWRLDPDGLARLVRSQDAILAEAARAVRPGGRLVYATCSIFEVENRARVTSFLSAHPDFAPGNAALALTPLDGGDGFFACELRRGE